MSVNAEQVDERLVHIRQRAFALDPDSHSALLAGLIGGCRAAAAWDTEAMEKVVEVMETVLSDHEGQPAK